MMVLTGFGSVSYGQSTASDSFEHKLKESAVPGAMMGSLVCQDARGARVLCSGSLDETVLGIVTNTPYITLNKPRSMNDSKFIFSALVDASSDPVTVGTHLGPGEGGKLTPVSEVSKAYAVALESASGSNAMIRVKILTR